MIVEDENAYVLCNYNLVSPKGKKLNIDVAEIWEVKNAKLTSHTIFFDTAAFGNFKHKANQNFYT